MLLVVEKQVDKRKINQQIKNIKPSKVFVSEKFAGKINWNEEPLEYQQRVRNEWN
jgi:hypothetical protein